MKVWLSEMIVNHAPDPDDRQAYLWDIVIRRYGRTGDAWTVQADRSDSIGLYLMDGTEWAWKRPGEATRYPFAQARSLALTSPNPTTPSPPPTLT